MKLRLQSNSLRLRLKRGEVDKLVKVGRIEEEIVFGSEPDARLHYSLETSRDASSCRAAITKNGIVVQVPHQVAADWAAGDDVGIEAMQSAGNDGALQILVEKDFACLNGPPEQNVDTFPNPLVGTKC